MSEFPIVRRSIPDWKTFLEVFSRAQYLDEVLGLLHASKELFNTLEGNNDDCRNALARFYLRVLRDYFEAFLQERRRQVKGDANSYYYLHAISFHSLRQAMKFCQYIQDKEIKENVAADILHQLSRSEIYWESKACQEQPMSKEIRDFLVMYIKENQKDSRFRLGSPFVRTVVLSGNSDLLSGGYHFQQSALAEIRECIKEWIKYREPGRTEKPTLQIMLAGKGWQSEALIVALQFIGGDVNLGAALDLILDERNKEQGSV